MMKRILCLLAAALLCLILPAAAEENVNVVTAAELDELLESVRAQVLTEELLNDPAGEDAESEDGTFFMYGTAGVYAEGTELTADTPVNTLVFDYTEGPVFRETGIDSRLDQGNGGGLRLWPAAAGRPVGQYRGIRRSGDGRGTVLPHGRHLFPGKRHGYRDPDQRSESRGDGADGRFPRGGVLQ